MDWHTGDEMTFLKNLRVCLLGHNDGEIIRQVRAKLSKAPQLDSVAFAKTYFSEEKQAIARKVWEISKEHSVADIVGIKPNNTFVEDLKMDDLDSLS